MYFSLNLAFGTLIASGDIKVVCFGGINYVSKTVHFDNPTTEYNTLTYLKQFKHPHIIEIQSLLGQPIPDDKYPTKYCNKFLLEKCDGDAFLYFENIQKSTRTFDEKMYELIRFMNQVIDALAFIHSKEIYHMDLKPENVFYQIKSGRVVFKLADFGSCLSKKYYITPYKSAPFLTNYYCPNEAFKQNKRDLADNYVRITSWDTFALAKMVLVYYNMFSGNPAPDYNIYGYCCEYPYTVGGGSFTIMLNRMMHCDPYKRPQLAEVRDFFKNYNKRYQS